LSEDSNRLTLSLKIEKSVKTNLVFLYDTTRSTCVNFPVLTSYSLCANGEYRAKIKNYEHNERGQMIRLPEKKFYDVGGKQILSTADYKVALTTFDNEVIVEFSKDNESLSYSFYKDDTCVDRMRYLLGLLQNKCENHYVCSIYYSHNDLDMYFPSKNQACYYIDNKLTTINFHYVNKANEQHSITVKNLIKHRVIGYTNDHKRPLHYSFQPAPQITFSQDKVKCDFKDNDFILIDFVEDFSYTLDNNRQKLWFLKEEDFVNGVLKYFADDSPEQPIIYTGVHIMKADTPNSLFLYEFYDENGKVTRKEFFTQLRKCTNKFDFRLAEAFKCDIKYNVFYIKQNDSIRLLKIYNDIGVITIKNFDTFTSYIFFEHVGIEKDNDKLTLKITGYDLFYFDEENGAEELVNLTESNKIETISYEIFSNDLCEKHLQNLISNEHHEKSYSSKIIGYKVITSEEANRALEYEEPDAQIIKNDTELLNMVKGNFVLGVFSKNSDERNTVDYFIEFSEKEILFKVWLKIKLSNIGNNGNRIKKTKLKRMNKK
jgi:hypothetical protein